MRSVINIILLGLIVFLAYSVYASIKEPIAFGDEKQRRKSAVVNSLENIREAQKVHMLIKGVFANSFEELENVLRNDSIPTIKIEGDPEDPDNPDKFISTTSYSPAIDSVLAMGIVLDGIGTIPFTDNKFFDIEADTVEYQKTNVAVVQVGTKWKDFMGIYADPKYGTYDSKYDPNKTIKFGDMTKPSLSGSWDR